MCFDVLSPDCDLFDGVSCERLLRFQPKLYAGDLLDLVASHFSLKEKEYFGLAYKDETRVGCTVLV